MAKVYLVSEGSYSDYGIRAAFSTEEKARKYVDSLVDPETGKTAGDDPRIEEYELDQEIPEIVWRDQYSVYLYLSTGNERNDRYYQKRKDRIYNTYDVSPRGRGQVFASTDLVYGLSYVSEAHALKLAAEARQAHLRGDSQLQFNVQIENGEFD